MDYKQLKEIVTRSKKIKRLVTELNQLTEVIQSKNFTSKIKDTTEVMKGLIEEYEKISTFTCKHCSSTVINGKCKGCKMNYLKIK